MSIEASYRRVTPEEFARLQANPEQAEAFLGTSLDDLGDLENLHDQRLQQEKSGRYLSIGADWHALHFLLTGDGELKPHPSPPPPLGNVVQGGTETQWACTYGYVRLLKPSEVREVAETLVRITVEELRSRFSVAAFNSALIYPHGMKMAWTEDDAESVFEIYPQVADFFQSAARDGDIILLSSD